MTPTRGRGSRLAQDSPARLHAAPRGHHRQRGAVKLGRSVSSALHVFGQIAALFRCLRFDVRLWHNT